MRWCVLDTNVLVVANGRDTHATDQCRLAAIRCLRSVQQANKAVIDSLGHIIDEYRKYCVHSGKPDVGDQFFMWLVQSQGSIKTADLEPHPERGYEEFPDDPELASFDQDDRKFVAAALAAGPDTDVINAVDSDYQAFAGALAAAGVSVVELCQDELKAFDTR